MAAVGEKQDVLEKRQMKGLPVRNPKLAEEAVTDEARGARKTKNTT